MQAVTNRKGLEKAVQEAVEADKAVEKAVEIDKGVGTDKKKEKVMSAASAALRQPLLDDQTVKRLDKSSKFLYNVLLSLNHSIEITGMELFGHDKDRVTWLLKEDIIEMFKDSKLSVTILQTFCM